MTALATPKDLELGALADIIRNTSNENRYLFQSTILNALVNVVCPGMSHGNVRIDAETKSVSFMVPPGYRCAGMYAVFTYSQDRRKGWALR